MCISIIHQDKRPQNRRIKGFLTNFALIWKNPDPNQDPYLDLRIWEAQKLTDLTDPEHCHLNVIVLKCWLEVSQ